MLYILLPPAFIPLHINAHAHAKYLVIQLFNVAATLLYMYIYRPIINKLFCIAVCARFIRGICFLFFWRVVVLLPMPGSKCEVLFSCL